MLIAAQANRREQVEFSLKRRALVGVGLVNRSRDAAQFRLHCRGHDVAEA